MDKEDKKEGLFKRLGNIKDKNEELLNAFSAANKVSKAAKNESDFNYDSKHAFYKFYRDFKKFKRMSLSSKYDEMNDFYAHPLMKQKIVKIELWIMSINFTINTSILTKKLW